MQDEAIGQTSDAGAIRIVEAAAIDGCYGIVLFRDAGSGIPLLIDVFCRSDFDTFRIWDLQQIPDEAGCLDLFSFSVASVRGLKANTFCLSVVVTVPRIWFSSS